MLPPKCRDALETILYIAMHAKGRAVSGAEICKYKGLPARGLESVLQQLVHHGILKGVTGPKGGYTLAKEKRKLSVADIIGLFWCSEQDAYEQTDIAQSAIKPLCEDLQSTLMLSLKHLTIDTLVQQLEDQSPERLGDFSI